MTNTLLGSAIERHTHYFLHVIEVQHHKSIVEANNDIILVEAITHCGYLLAVSFHEHLV
jgi:hypothetical protein